MPADKNQFTWKNKISNDYPTKYTFETLKNILEYMKMENI